MHEKHEILVAAASFEDRALVETKAFLEAGGEPSNILLADVFEMDEQYSEGLDAFNKLEVTNRTRIDRFSAKDVWSWAWNKVGKACTPGCHLAIDISCMPRELLAMVLFAVSLRKKEIASLTILYVSAPPKGYATQNDTLEERDRWLSRGVTAIRSIIGYPGHFYSERPSHLIALAGHEFERLLRTIEHFEPSIVTVSAEQANSSTTAGAGELSEKVVDELRTKIQVPTVGNFEFSSSSIRSVYSSLETLGVDHSEYNVGLVAMNTKLSFVGAALFALRKRHVRMLYAVPKEYNPLYCEGIGNTYREDISDLLMCARTDDA